MKKIQNSHPPSEYYTDDKIHLGRNQLQDTLTGNSVHTKHTGGEFGYVGWFYYTKNKSRHRQLDQSAGSHRLPGEQDIQHRENT